MTLYLKALRPGRRGTHTDFVWPLDEWVRVKGALVGCENGFHVCRPDQILDWLNVELWLIEADGRYKAIDHWDKMVVRHARLVRQLAAWDKRTARLFAADCAERVLYIFEREYPGDDRPRKAIEASRAYARGDIGDAARDAARDAAWDAAGDAGDAGDAGAAARAAARAAAWDAARAARAAAWDAAWAARAARAAERDWQTTALLNLLDLTAQERTALGIDKAYR